MTTLPPSCTQHECHNIFFNWLHPLKINTKYVTSYHLVNLAKERLSCLHVCVVTHSDNRLPSPLIDLPRKSIKLVLASTWSSFYKIYILQLCTQPATYTQVQSLTVIRKRITSQSPPNQPTPASHPYPPISNSCLLHAPSLQHSQAEGPPGGGGGFNGHREYFSTCICQWLLTSHSFSWMSRHVNKINCRWTNINPAHPSPNPSGCSCYHTDFPLTSAAHDFFWKTCLP